MLLDSLISQDFCRSKGDHIHSSWDQWKVREAAVGRHVHSLKWSRYLGQPSHTTLHLTS